MPPILLAVLLAQSLDVRARDALVWPNTRAADLVSYGTVATAIALPCLQGESKLDPTCVQGEGLRVGAAVLAAEVTKRLVQRTRPDGSDRKSFYSMHTSICFAARGRRWVNAALCGSTAYLRLAGKKHWLTDVLTGTAAGLALAQAVR